MIKSTDHQVVLAACDLSRLCVRDVRLPGAKGWFSEVDCGIEHHEQVEHAALGMGVADGGDWLEAC